MNSIQWPKVPKFSLSGVLHFSIVILLFSGLCLKHFTSGSKPDQMMLTHIAIGGQQVPRDRDPLKIGGEVNGSANVKPSATAHGMKGDLSLGVEPCPDFSAVLLKCRGDQSTTVKDIGGMGSSQQVPKGIVRHARGNLAIGGPGNMPAPRSPAKEGPDTKECCFSPDYFKSRRAQDAYEFDVP